MSCFAPGRFSGVDYSSMPTPWRRRSGVGGRARRSSAGCERLLRELAAERGRAAARASAMTAAMGAVRCLGDGVDVGRQADV